MKGSKTRPEQSASSVELLDHRETSQVWAGMAHVILHQAVARLEPAERETLSLEQLHHVDAIRHDVHSVF